ncbi:MAG: GTP-binding protein, partial [Bacteroidota bacterium]
MKVYQTNEIKNIALVGGTRSGKTTIGEAMLLEGGVITRRGTIEEKNTVSDYKELELERQSSVFSGVLHAEFNNHKINIIDTPGIDDFIGEVCSALKVADTAVMVINAQNGIEVGTEIVWRFTTRNNTPVSFIVNQLDHEKANFDETIRQLQTQFGNKVTLFQYPVNPGMGFNAVIDVFNMKMIKFAADGKPEILDIPEGEKAKAEELHTKIVEVAAECDEAMMEKFFENGVLTEQEIRDGIRKGIAGRNVYPLFCVCSKHNMGIKSFMEFVTESFPSPAEMPAMITKEGKEIKPDPNGTPLAFVFKTSIEQHLGELSYFKVASGTITEGLDLLNANTLAKERLSQLFVMAGKNRTKVDKVCAGDIAATIKLKDTRTNNTLNTSKNNNDIIEPAVYPEPRYRIAVRAKNTNDEEKLGGILRNIHDEDPTFIIEQSVELKQTILNGQGELHVNVAKWRIENLDKIEIEFINPKIPYRETITKSA